MSTCLTSGGRTYGFDLEIVKPSSSSPRSSHSSSSSSTLSESSNSPLTISTRKPRTPRKRPNQAYTEAATLLSAINPDIFPTKNPTKIYKSTRFYSSFSESSELLPPFPALDNPGFLLHEYIPEKTVEKISTKPTFHSTNSCSNSTKTDVIHADCEDDFDAESILDEETEQGIDSIMGNLSVTNDIPCEPSYTCYSEKTPIGLGFGSNFAWGFGAYRHVSALRRVPDNDWWRFPTVDVLEIFPKRKVTEKKKKVEEHDNNSNSIKKPVPRLCLKLNYEEVQNAWSHNDSPFSDEISVTSRPDAIARLAQFDLLFPELYPFGEENEGIREASVFRYREKRRTRLFSRKIRYQVRKVNADRRPRMKGRFVRRPSLLHDKARNHLGSLADEGCVKHHIPINHSKPKQRRS